ncbi:hypothetical protein HOP50_12g66260 [Chloropicon primus]|uniref:Uncharacterized protein n=2 Tax=Chloropicon primus TaxID=1764295 RepID=A0A5B8MU40_9CHLO|nr:hypothetical protein A3770_12p66070 [Chloropicon primus]UPR03297.1 hypothetical protein HOP50_12g66260 [Chloropicon primus]|eukprot:QDZ24089.1 hypothetical protein A3770_12p66070 [Chloropicon primus]
MVRVVRDRAAAKAEALSRERERRARAKAFSSSGRRPRRDGGDGTVEERSLNIHNDDDDDDEVDEVKEEERRTHVVYLPESATREEVKGEESSGWFRNDAFSFVSCEVFKFLLYMRGLIPDMYDTLVQDHERERERRLQLEQRGEGTVGRLHRSMAGARSSSKFTRFRQKSSQVLKCLSQQEVFLGGSGEPPGGSGEAVGSMCEVLYIFGASVRKPIEAYLLRASCSPALEPPASPAAGTRGGGGASGTRRSLLSFLAKVNRTLVTAIMGLEDEKRQVGAGSHKRRRRGDPGGRKRKEIPKRCKVHVLVRTSGGDQGRRLDGFFPQVGVNLGALSPLVISIKPKGDERERAEGTPETQMGGWLQCATVLQGIQ